MENASDRASHDHKRVQSGGHRRVVNTELGVKKKRINNSRSALQLNVASKTSMNISSNFR